MARHSAPLGPAVLVTRPSGEAAEDLCRKVCERGFSVYHQPLLTLSPLASLDAPARQCVLDLDRYAHVIFVSANAVRFGMAHIEDYWPQLPVGLNWFAIGSATASLLGRYGVEAQAPVHQMTSEGLLALPALARVEDQRVLIVKGRGGRNALRQELEKRGARVDELACYERGLPTLPEGELASLLERSNITAILLSSGEGLTNLQVLLSPTESSNFSKGITLVVPSERVAQQARDAGFLSIVVAENASDTAMLDALTTWNASSQDTSSGE